MFTVFLYIVAGYIVVSWIFVLSCFAYYLGSPEGKQETLEDLKRIRKEIRIKNNSFFWLIMLASFLILLFLIPFLTPSLFNDCFLNLFREARKWKQFGRKHREKLFERLHPANLPKSASEYFERLTPELEALNFNMLGDYLMKGDPLRIYMRSFLSSDGVIFGELSEICCDGIELTGLDAQHNCNFLTVLSGQRSLETTTADPSPRVDLISKRGICIGQCLGQVSPAEALQRHIEKLREMESIYGDTALAFSPEQFRDVYTWNGRSFSLEKYKLGKLDAPPPPPVFPQGRPVSIQGWAQYCITDIAIPVGD